jgi:hypothetical protein
VGCVTFVTDYDDTFDNEIATTQKDTDALVLKIAENPTQPYASFKDDYDKVQTDIDSLRVRASTHSNNSDTISSVDKIQHTFSEWRDRHASAPVTAAFAKGELETMNIEYAILMKQELAKKSGASK